MIGLDTNVLVRYAVRDDARQTALADQLFDAFDSESPGYLSHIVLVETWWVLRRAYGFAAEQCRAFLAVIVDVRGIHVEDSDLVRTALQRTANGADFADALLTVRAEASGAEPTMTFDRRAVRDAGMTLLTAASVRALTSRG